MISQLKNLFRKKISVCSIINFCTHDYRFLRSCVEEASRFSDQILVAYSDHFFDGLPENQALLLRARQENPEAEFVFLPYQANPEKDSQYWVTMLRWNALAQAEKNITHILFLDADEIADGHAVSVFLKSSPPGKESVLKLANHYYFRESCYRAIELEDSATLVRKSLLKKDLVVDYQDRNKAWEMLPEPKKRMVKSLDGKPMIHHFSWVRTKEEMLRKVKSWGHAGERNWEELVEEEFSHPFNGSDFIHGYRYEEVKTPFPEIAL
jgi:hypothetical protein